jgi:hypothetical protein
MTDKSIAATPTVFLLEAYFLPSFCDELLSILLRLTVLVKEGKIPNKPTRS